MNTATTPLRLTAAASVVALAVTLAGCATADPASAADESRAHSATQVVVTPAMHRALVRSAADRYVNELLVRARMAQSAPPASLDVVLTRVSGL